MIMETILYKKLLTNSVRGLAISFLRDTMIFLQYFCMRVLWLAN